VSVEVITIGSELLNGLVRNTNVDLIGDLLAEVGLEAAYHTTVGDDGKRIGEVFRTAVHRAEVVIATGGLGPTPDDLTRRVIATVFRRRLILDQVILDRIRARFKERGQEMPPVNEAQALIPRGARVIENHRGTAPGLHFTHLRTELFALPGVPSEAEMMLREYVIPCLRAATAGLARGLRVVRTIGIGESALAERLSGFEMEEPDLKLGMIARASGVDVHISASSRDGAWLNVVLDRAERKLWERAGRHAYGRGRETLSEVLGRALLGRDLTIATAESFTGGTVGAEIVATPGSSRYYKGGVIAYSNDAKESLLSVGRETLERKGAVSAEVAEEMARGARIRLGAHCAVSTTGIAGPDGATTAGKPVGLAYLGFSTAEGESSERWIFGGSRADVIAKAAAHALDLSRRNLGVNEEWFGPSSRS
jgi:nicotinamide-nucleotide amidase